MAVTLNPAIDKKTTECNCAPCRSFWKKAFHEGGDCIAQLSSERAGATSILGNQGGLVRKGDRVLVNGSNLSKKSNKKLPGVVQYVGLADDHLIAPEMHVGVCLYDNVYSTHNGVYNGKRFFFTPRGHGAMVKYSEITPLNPIPRTRPVNGNQMFPSYEQVRKRRKEREQKILDAEEKIRKEHEMKRRLQMERYSKSAPHPRISPRPTKASKLRTEYVVDQPESRAHDEHDIAYKDYKARERQRQSQFMDDETKEEMQLRQMKKAFGGDEKASRMAETLRKLQRGYEEGRAIALLDKE